MSGYTKEDQERFVKMANELLKNRKKKAKPKKIKRKRGLKKGKWKEMIK